MTRLERLERLLSAPGVDTASVAVEAQCSQSYVAMMRRGERPVTAAVLVAARRAVLRAANANLTAVLNSEDDLE